MALIIPLELPLCIYHIIYFVVNPVPSSNGLLFLFSKRGVGSKSRMPIFSGQSGECKPVYFTPPNQYLSPSDPGRACK